MREKAMPIVELELDPEQQRRILLGFVGLHTPRPEDSIKAPLVDSVEQCLRRDELSLGLAVVALVAARGAGLQHRCAEWLWQQLADRTGIDPSRL